MRAHKYRNTLLLTLRRTSIQFQGAIPRLTKYVPYVLVTLKDLAVAQSGNIV